MIKDTESILEKDFWKNVRKGKIRGCIIGAAIARGYTVAVTIIWL